MWARRTRPSPESETALRAAEKSLQQAKAHHPEVEAKLSESRRVKEQLQAHNRVTYSDFIQSIVLGQKPSAAS
ncbi:hypothetical protein ACH4FA_03930 [Streptomyces sp. NPDC017966]|uniref:hypothetical protein n=1 Tax=Streptomyces sp. NPDC017966 TaxID=3365023 RepID=UPI003787A9C7